MITEKTKWYHKTGGVILLLVLFFPAGLYLMWKYTNWNRKVKWAITGFFALMAIIQASTPAPKTDTQTSTSTQTSTKTTSPTEAPKSVEKMQIVVTSQIVKKVDGKYRYFFDIRNKDTKNFEGSVSIAVYNGLQNSPLGGETFKTNKPIEPNLGTSVYFDIFTGPTSVHGENGISKFKYVVRKDDQTVNEGEGVISSKFENLSGF